MRILGVILAGGQARRMGGGDKGLLDLGGRSLIEEVAARMKPQCEALILNANGDPARFQALGLPVEPDGVAGFPGPLAGVLAGMERAAASGFTHVLSAAADTPFPPRDLAARLIAAAEASGAPIALAATRREGKLARHPTFGLWSADLRADLRATLEAGLFKVSLWAERHGAVSAAFPQEPFDPFFNVNTPEDLAQAREIWENLRRL